MKALLVKALLASLSLLALLGAGALGTVASRKAAPAAPQVSPPPQAPPPGAPWYVVCDVQGLYSAQGLPPEVALGTPYTRVVGQRNTACTFMLSPVPPYNAVQYPTQAAADADIAAGVYSSQCKP